MLKKFVAILALIIPAFGAFSISHADEGKNIVTVEREPIVGSSLVADVKSDVITKPVAEKKDVNTYVSANLKTPSADVSTVKAGYVAAPSDVSADTASLAASMDCEEIFVEEQAVIEEITSDQEETKDMDDTDKEQTVYFEAVTDNTSEPPEKETITVDISDNETIDGFFPVKVYVEDEVVALCETEEEANDIAQLYGITLKSFNLGVAVFDTNGMVPGEIIKKGQENGWPEVGYNYIFKLYTEPVQRDESPVTVY